MVHGREAATQAETTARTTFEEGALAENLPSIETAKSELDKGIGILNASVQAGFVSSTSEARRQIKAGGIKVNDITVTDEKLTLTPKDLTPEGVIKLSLGKKRHVLLRAV
jgi:tyrosyl-tRNA synthetase